jgi:hypothetical protein
VVGLVEDEDRPAEIGTGRRVGPVEAAAPQGGEGLPEGRRLDDAEQGLAVAVAQAAERHCEHREPGDVVRRPVQGVDHPAVPGRGLPAGPFLGEQAVAGEGLRQGAGDEALGPAVELGDDAPVLAFGRDAGPEAGEQQFPNLSRDPGGPVEAGLDLRRDLR